jgi:hypothetical protein
VREIQDRGPTVSPRAAWISLLIELAVASAVLIPVLMA